MAIKSVDTGAKRAKYIKKHKRELRNEACQTIGEIRAI